MEFLRIEAESKGRESEESVEAVMDVVELT